METVVEITISLLTMLTVYLVGSKHKYAPLCGIFTESCWTVWVIGFEHYGLLPMNIMLLIMYVRMYIKWK